jgi:glycosyltransferase involved in cell wall biosynthesis
MKILLLGEYSRLHNTLKEGLIALGHSVVLVGTGDGFKQFPSDFDVSSSLKKSWIGKKTGVAVYKLTGFDIFKKDVFRNLLKIAPKLKDFDIVQLINEDAFDIYPQDAIRFYKKIIEQNNRLFLSGCGDDYHVINYYKQQKMRYSILTPFFNNPNLKNEYNFSLKYLSEPYVKLHQFLMQHIEAVIPSDMDYAIPYAHFDKAEAMIPNPINVDKIVFKKLKIEDKINIFFGVNLLSFYKKGSDIVLKVLDRIKVDFADEVNIVIAQNLPYDEYINKYNDAHILIDQLYSYDQGYNALEAMAKGKCVLTGAEKEFEAYYNLSEQVAVNVLPDENDLYKKLSEFIKNKQKIVEIGQNARFFIEKHHNYKEIAQKYLNTWFLSS